MDAGPQRARRWAISDAVGGRSMTLYICAPYVPMCVGPKSRTVTFTHTAQTTASTVMQTSSVASENWRRMDRIVADKRRTKRHRAAVQVSTYEQMRGGDVRSARRWSRERRERAGRA